MSSHQNDKFEDKDVTKHEKTSIMFERKKKGEENFQESCPCKDKSCQSKDCKCQDKNCNCHKSHEKEHHWSKEKDKDWNKEKDKESHIGKDKDLYKKEIHYENKDLNKDKKEELHYEKKLGKDKDKDKEMHDKEIHDKEKSEDKSIISTIKEKVKDVLGSTESEKSKDKDVHMTDEYNKAAHDKYGSSTVGVSGSGAQNYPSNLGSSGSGAYQTSNLGTSGSTFHSETLGSSKAAVDKPFTSGPSGVGAAYSGSKHPTVDNRNLGAEHREVGYDKHSNVIPHKEKEKDTVHKVDVHGSLYTSGAGSTFEAK